jgi:hypothetical protein
MPDSIWNLPGGTLLVAMNSAEAADAGNAVHTASMPATQSISVAKPCRARMRHAAAARSRMYPIRAATPAPELNQ